MKRTHLVTPPLPKGHVPLANHSPISDAAVGEIPRAAVRRCGYMLSRRVCDGKISSRQCCASVCARSREGREALLGLGGGQSALSSWLLGQCRLFASPPVHLARPEPSVEEGTLEPGANRCSARLSPAARPLPYAFPLQVPCSLLRAEPLPAGNSRSSCGATSPHVRRPTPRRPALGSVGGICARRRNNFYHWERNGDPQSTFADPCGTG